MSKGPSVQTSGCLSNKDRQRFKSSPPFWSKSQKHLNSHASPCTSVLTGKRGKVGWWLQFITFLFYSRPGKLISEGNFISSDEQGCNSLPLNNIKCNIVQPLSQPRTVNLFVATYPNVPSSRQIFRPPHFEVPWLPRDPQSKPNYCQTGLRPVGEHTNHL